MASTKIVHSILEEIDEARLLRLQAKIPAPAGSPASIFPAFVRPAAGRHLGAIRRVRCAPRWHNGLYLALKSAGS
jgi:hypothetical protein